MDFSIPDDHAAIRAAVRELCAPIPTATGASWTARHAYPTDVRPRADRGRLAGGADPRASTAAPAWASPRRRIILEEINRAGGNAGAGHAQMYIMGTLLRHGSAEQKQRYLPRIARGELRLQAFGVTEPDAGSETTRLQTTAVRHGDRYVVNGQKIWTSRARALRPDAAAGAHHALRGADRQDARA